MLKLSKYPHGGFTLIELLVVVLIIGILAAIALPQYKLAVAKTQYATLKNISKATIESARRYYLVHDSYPTKFSDLDVDFVISNTFDYLGVSFYFYLKGAEKAEKCEFYYSNGTIYCDKIIASSYMRYGIHSNDTRRCITYSLDTADITNRVCQNETGRTAAQANCNSYTCTYWY